MKILERHLGTITYASGQTRTLDLPRNYAYRALYLRLTAVVTNTQTTAGVVLDSMPAQLVSNLQVRANGRDVIKNIDLATLHRLTQYRYGTRPRITSRANTGATTTAAGTVEVNAVLPFEMWRAVKPIDTLLNSAGLATLELITTFGAGTALFGGAYGGTITVVSAQLDVWAVEVVGVPPGTNFMVNKEFSIESVITAASTNHQISLPVSNLYRSFLIKTVSDDVHVDTILNNIQLKSGTEVFKNLRAADVQAQNKVDYGLELPVSTAVLENSQAGLYMVEFVRDGRLTEALDTSRLSSLEFVLDVSNPGTTDVVTIYPVELIAPPVRAGAA